MTPEDKARQEIDAQLTASGWVVQTKDKINLSASRGVAICELSFATGEPDYTLFVDAKALGTVEAKPAGVTLTSVEEQSAKYVSGVPKGLPAWKSPLPFCYESTGAETFFINRLDPQPRSRRVFSFHRPETLLAWVQQEKQLAQRLQEFPELTKGNLWPAQFEAIKNLEVSLIAGRPRALIQMATGSGKTFTAVNFIYRLVKYAGAKRVLFLVDRGNLGDQTLKEFQQFVSPVNNYKFATSFREYIEQHQAEITALQLLYSRPYKQRLTELMLKELEKKLRDQHAAWTEDNLWSAFAAAKPGKVKGRSQAGRFADLVALVRFALEQQPVLEPFAESVAERFNEWLMDKAKAGVKFDGEHLAWLNLIRDHIATSLSIEPDDFESVPFNQIGGLGKAHQLFGEQLPKLLDELNEVLAA